MMNSRISSPTSSTFPSPPPVLAPIAEQESSGITTAQATPNISEEMSFTQAQRIVPPDDSLTEVRAIPAQVIEELENQETERVEEATTTPAQPSRNIIFPIMPFYSRKDGCSKCNIWLGLLFVLFFLLSIALFLVWAITSDGFKNLGSQSSKVCNSKECINTAFRFSSYSDDNVDPCENFYRFSCTKFHLLNSDQQKNFLDRQLESTKRIVYNLLSTDPGSGPKSSRMAKTLFETCMDGAERARTGKTAMINFLKNFPCGPIMEQCQDFNPIVYNWERHVGMLNWYAGDGNLIVYGRDVDPRDKNRLILQFRPPNLEEWLNPLRQNLVQTVNPSLVETDALLQASIKLNLLSDFVSHQLSRDPHHVDRMMDDLAFFFMELNERSSIYSNVNRNTTYMTIGELIRTVPEINFREMMNADLSNIYKWTDNDMVAVENLDYFKYLGGLTSRTNKETLANYLLIITGLNLSKYSFDNRTQFSWRECVDQLLGLHPVEKMFILHRKGLKADKIKHFLESLKDDFLNTHRQYPLQNSVEINRMAFLVAFPQRLTNEYQVWQPFSDISINQSDYFQSATKVLKSQWNSEMKNIGVYLDNDDAPIFPVLKPTLIYLPHLSTIVLPLSFLQEPLSLPGENVPWYTIYGSFGVTVQQLIAKIFWANRNQANQKQCLDSTYRSFLNQNYRNMNLESDLSYTIEMADALKTSIYGYLKWERDSTNYNEPSLPAFEKYDSIQTMLMSFGTLFCNTEGTQPGSQYEAMMNTAASNSQRFSMHFQCTNTSLAFNRRNCV
ncbi:unnamed protein product [Auanema sp. JU1783]|nr:unnamed protein product [Auanema sp. JU1783]